jgi:hypothetical protein
LRFFIKWGLGIEKTDLTLVLLSGYAVWKKGFETKGGGEELRGFRLK